MLLRFRLQQPSANTPQGYVHSSTREPSRCTDWYRKPQQFTIPFCRCKKKYHGRWNMSHSRSELFTGVHERYMSYTRAQSVPPPRSRRSRSEASRPYQACAALAEQDEGTGCCALRAPWNHYLTRTTPLALTIHRTQSTSRM